MNVRINGAKGSNTVDSRPIGFFDSGLGGASVLREALNLLPRENYIFYGDNGNAPYGDRSEEEITALSFKCAHFLVEQGVKAILIACNTATSAAIRDIRGELSLPVISVEPAIKPACALPGDGKVLMCATRATTQLARYRALQARMPDPSRVINVPCPGIVERVERGILDEDAFDDLMEGYFSQYEGIKVDAIVLGCTHYIFIKDAFLRAARKHFGCQPALLDGNAATVRQLGRVLEANSLVNGEGSASVEFYTSGERAKFQPLFEMLLNAK